MDPKEVQALIDAALAKQKTTLDAEYTAKFAEHKASPPEDSADKKVISDLQADIEARDKKDLDAKVVKFGEFTEGLKEREVNGVKKGLPPALIAKITAFGTAQLTPGSDVVKFAEGKEVDLLSAAMEIIEEVAKTKALCFSGINSTGDDVTSAQADIEAGIKCHG